MDEVDKTTERQDQLDQLAINGHRNAATSMSAGHPGECDRCGEFNDRLVERRHFQRNGRRDIAEQIENGICPRCRDLHKLP